MNMAAGEGHHAIVSALIEARADIDLAGDQGVTPFSTSAAGVHIDIVKLLADARADLDKANGGRCHYTVRGS